MDNGYRAIFPQHATIDVFWANRTRIPWRRMNTCLTDVLLTQNARRTALPLRRAAYAALRPTTARFVLLYATVLVHLDNSWALFYHRYAVPLCLRFSLTIHAADLLYTILHLPAHYYAHCALYGLRTTHRLHAPHCVYTALCLRTRTHTAAAHHTRARTRRTAPPAYKYRLPGTTSLHLF